jgi:hypothetical protein
VDVKTQSVFDEIDGLIIRQNLRYNGSIVDAWGAALIWVLQVGG